ncbi:MAG: tetratricopeptide repeat protein [Thermoanaerobaculia bacterium]
MSRRVGRLAWVAMAALLAAACGQTGPVDDGAGATGSEPAADGTPQIPEPDMDDMEPQVAKRLRQTRAAALSDILSAAAWGRFGMVAHAHELWDEALAAYLRAEKLDRQDERWPYYLGDVLSVVGTDPEAAIRAFRRAMALRKDYAPAHLRLGRALLAAGLDAAAAKELERAIELAPDLQPARVALAQLLLAGNQPEHAAEMLEEVLREAPRHGQALAALGQAYMRLGRRDEARRIAERARDAAAFNLYSDPLMSQVVAEGVSSVLIWDRAKAFLENGDYQQAALGLQQVVKLQPGNGDAHQQLGVAYGNLGDVERSRRHLERTVALDPDRVAARIQLATVHLDQQNPAAALPHLRRIQELAPDDPDAGWLLGRAQVLTGDVAGALATFDSAASAGGEAPAWARNDWGSALAQSGRADAALEQFRAALAVDPDDAQALFYTGLVLEGLGRVDEALEHYCRSMKAQPNPPAATRLEARSHSCG